MSPAASGVLLLGLALGASDSSAPWQLRCLERHYPVKAVRQDRGWGLSLPDGSVLPFDDHKVKTPEERVEAPDLEDMFVSRYRRGQAEPVVSPADEPGRARVVALFNATYGDAGSALPLRTVRLGAGSVRVHARIASVVERIAATLTGRASRDDAVARALQAPAGGHARRPIAGTTRPSAHSWGMAIDIDVRVSDYWRWAKGPVRWRNRVPQAIIDAFEAEGFIWGGRWFHYDTMHFEFRPELLDASCRSSSP